MSITRPTKITRENSLPNSIEERCPVYAKSFNALVDIVEELADGVDGLNDGVIPIGTIDEAVAGAGVTIDGLLIKDGHSGKVTTATATDAGLTTGALTGSDQFVTVTSGSANSVVCLPAEATTPIGTIIQGWVGANGFELRPIAAEAATTTINGVTTSVEAAIPATTLFEVKKVAANTWLLTAVDELGAVITAIIPDAV